jgi:hypothetical protein
MRWSIEVFFREAKQLLGFADSCARLSTSVLRVAPLVGMMYSVLVVWFIECPDARRATVLPVRPWYGHKRGLSFADILSSARRVIGSRKVLKEVYVHANLNNATARALAVRNSGLERPRTPHHNSET